MFPNPTIEVTDHIKIGDQPHGLMLSYVRKPLQARAGFWRRIWNWLTVQFARITDFLDHLVE